MPRYNVVFEGTYEGVGKPSSNLKGIRTWTSYESLDEFNEHREDSKDTIIAEGVTEQEALKLVAQTTGEARARFVIWQSRQPGVTAMIRKMHYMNGAIAAATEGHIEAFLDTLEKEAPELR